MSMSISVMGLYYYDNGLFDDMQIPEQLDKESFVMELLARLSALEVLYPDPDLMRKLIGVWSVQRLHSWQRIYDALYAEYNATHNYHREEEWEDSGSGNSSGSAEQKTVGFDGNQLVTTGSTGSSGTTAFTNRKSGKAFGNIGVTTTQKMIAEEMELRSGKTIYDVIIDDFKQRFCLLVY